MKNHSRERKLGWYDATWYTAHNGTTFETISRILLEWCNFHSTCYHWTKIIYSKCALFCLAVSEIITNSTSMLCWQYTYLCPPSKLINLAHSRWSAAYTQPQLDVTGNDMLQIGVLIAACWTWHFEQSLRTLCKRQSLHVTTWLYHWFIFITNYFNLTGRTWNFLRYFHILRH